ncbi:ribosome small subunit-dependent GTPase A [Youngiibacter multivorans]|uniref:Small ribosomal subunit biogenesis GTPase RsgA n=1 Tax=Youngiibacter multivorans TaxID=937251 RepID=A0ABS4G614_9CLOT|nr:ribosome small subunit-dependent GTPase A [Youngiibacter multivorans]MBP1919995.1 ribosome biogenesis GTPase [Youngiibacter multivorans]
MNKDTIPFIRKEEANSLFPGAFAGRIAEEEKELYTVITSKGTMLASVTGKMMQSASSREDYPAVGDYVALDRDDDSQGFGRILGVLKRSSCIRRKAAGDTTGIQVIAANVDMLFLTMALNQDFNIRRLERYIAVAKESWSVSIILLTKLDLAENLGEKLEEVRKAASGGRIILLSNITGEGVDEVRELISEGITAAFIGSSGIGKSSVINSLLGVESLAIGGLRKGDGKGRHTTTHRELILLPSGGLVIDTPGMRELHLLDDISGVDEAFSDILTLSSGCRFKDCSHRAEPGCKVQEALSDGTLDRKRLESYEKLQKEARHMAAAMDDRIRREKKAESKKLGKLIKEVKKDRRKV